ncbi:MAG: hypothetical protein JEY96_17010 [Bacteroidales bacterium]|nr:hypothetical protein [Bacteroidales bacterium]
MKNEIAEAIKELAGLALMPFIIGKVESVDGRTCTVNPVDGGAAIENVRLNAYTDGNKGIVITPKKDSFVIVGMLDEVDAMVLMSDEVEIIEAIIANTSFKMSDGEMLFNGGGNGGLIIVANLVDKMNAIESKLNDVINTLKTVTIPLAPSGTYPLATDFGDMTVLSETSTSDIENEDIKH